MKSRVIRNINYQGEKREGWEDLGEGFLGGSMVKNLPVNAGDTGDVVLGFLGS